MGNTPAPANTSTPAPAPTATPIAGLEAINGTHLYYEILGQGAPLFVLHGGPGASHTYFLPYLGPLSDNYQLVFYDQRGTGLSDGHLDLSAITIKQFVADLEALRIALGFEKISLLGHSWGGNFALAYALQYPTHLDRLILADSIPLNAEFGIGFSQTMQQRVQALSASDQQARATTCAAPSSQLSPAQVADCNRIDALLRFYDPAKAAAVAWAMEPNTLKNADTVSSLINNNFSRVRSDMIAQLPALRVPTLIIHGDFDPIPLASAEYLQQRIPGSQLVVIAHSGHFSFIEQPEQFVAAVRAFLAH